MTGMTTSLGHDVDDHEPPGVKGWLDWAGALCVLAAMGVGAVVMVAAVVAGPFLLAPWVPLWASLGLVPAASSFWVLRHRRAVLASE